MSYEYAINGSELVLVSIPEGTIHMIVPANVTTLEDYVTSKACTSLQRVTFLTPSNLRSLRQRTFENCSLLHIIDFRNCTKLSSILSRTFHNCCLLEKVFFPDSLYQFDTECFVNTSIKSFNIPTKLIHVGIRSFYGVSTLESIDFSDAQNIKTLYSSSFAYTHIKVIDLRNCTSLKVIMDGCFSFCPMLERVYFPCTSQQITFKELVFLNCSSLQLVYFPSCRTHIKLSASTFSHCDKLILPSGLQFMIPQTQINRHKYFLNCLLFISIIIHLSH